MRFFPWLLCSLLLTPVSVLAAAPITLCENAWHDPVRRRTVPVRIRVPAGAAKLPVILFSHGLGGSLDAGAIWAQGWAEAGFAVVNVQHPGSDSAIFGKPGFKSALGGDQLMARAGDIQFVIGELGRRVIEGTCDLKRIDMARIGMAGHSFGAQTVQAIAGQQFLFVMEPPMSDPRVRAAIGFSPSPPLIGSPAEAFARIRIPFLSITGTEDAVPSVYPVTALQRQEPFRMMPPGDKFLLVLNGATHEMLAGQLSPTMLNGEPPVHIRNTVIAISVAFWRAMLQADKPALQWLQNPAELRAGLSAGDIFEARLTPPPSPPKAPLSP
ncbi:alpha/beta hydrolase family protein [Sphingomonas sp. SRS2]|uniref:alpha/beta hydrolase family protein n=1 Tax=Sphingomonas sp. SRS2 TaxID=133190 RepID=UPI0006184BD6|nr:dienelactone hydrolase [Sphingomonas sp. SRS2]KKC23883.1 dienelactone hydrolase [Sphingomonas sp. SRS2]